MEDLNNPVGTQRATYLRNIILQNHHHQNHLHLLQQLVSCICKHLYHFYFVFLQPSTSSGFLWPIFLASSDSPDKPDESFICKKDFQTLFFRIIIIIFISSILLSTFANHFIFLLIKFRDTNLIRIFAFTFRTSRMFQ